MNNENKIINFMKKNSDTVTTKEVNNLNIPRITLTRLMREDIDKKKLYTAIYNTFKRRNKLYLLNDLTERYDIIKSSLVLRQYFENYQRKNYYARSISYDSFLEAINNIIEIVEEEKQFI